jgi:hypothetical protein
MYIRSSKSALHGLVHWAANAYAKIGITVNGVAPALIADTKMLPGNPEELARSMSRILEGLGYADDAQIFPSVDSERRTRSQIRLAGWSRTGMLRTRLLPWMGECTRSEQSHRSSSKYTGPRTTPPPPYSSASLVHQPSYHPLHLPASYQPLLSFPAPQLSAPLPSH